MRVIGSSLPVQALPVKGVEPGSSQLSEILGLGHASITTFPVLTGRKERAMARSTQQSQTESPATAMLSPEQVVQQLRALREQIPLPDALPAIPASRRRRLAHVDSQFVVAAINATGASPAVQTALGRTDEELRQESDVSNRWTAVIDEVRALLESLVDANTVRRQRIGLAALQTYKICQQLARDDAQATRLAAHIGEMKKLNKFGRSRRKAPQPDPQPIPAPAPQAPAG
jgi:hypothetical protein